MCVGGSNILGSNAVGVFGGPLVQAAFGGKPTLRGLVDPTEAFDGARPSNTPATNAAPTNTNVFVPTPAAKPIDQTVNSQLQLTTQQRTALATGTDSDDPSDSIANKTALGD